MKSAYALTLCLSGMMGVDAWVLPGGAAPKSNYALQRPNDQAGNRNSAGTGIKFSPNQGSSAPKSGTVPGFIPVKGLAGGPSKRHSLYMRAAQPDDDGDDDAGDDEDAQMTAFSHPAFRIGTLKQADSGDETKSFKVNNKKQNGKNKADDKKSKHSGDDDSTKTSEDNKTKTSSGASATKTTSKSSGSKHSGDDKKKVDDKKPKHSGGDDGTKTSKDHKTKTSSAASATKTPSKSSGSKHSGDDKKKTSKKVGNSKSSTKSKSKDAAHKSHTSKHS